MAGLTTGAWWPLTAESANAQQSENRASNENVSSYTKKLTKPASYWSWSAGLALEPRASDDRVSPADVGEQVNEEPSTWWATLMGPPAAANKNQQTSPPPNLVQSSTQRKQAHENANAKDADYKSRDHQDLQILQRSWFPWLFFQGPSILDSESDTEDKGDLETFREAKLAIELSKESCHYAVYKDYDLNEVYLAVHGTSTENTPVKFNEKKQPIMPHQHLENAITEPKTVLSPEYPSLDQRNIPQDESTQELTHAKTAVNYRQRQPQSVSANDSSSVLPDDIVNGVTAKNNHNGENHANRSSTALSASLKSECPRRENTVYPDLDCNFRVITLSTKLRLWGEAMIHKEPTSERHIYKSTRPSVERKRKVIARNALVISVHTFLPTKFVRSVILQSTGNASLIALNAVDSVRRWVAQDNLDHLNIKSIALDGIGTTLARTERSIELLNSWNHEIRNADLIFVASNSAASPVAIQILDHIMKTPHLGLEHQRVGFLSMSGALSGPLIGLDTKVIRRAYSYNEYDIINEMFELLKSNSALSRKLAASIDFLCQMNVKFTLAGSVDDQFIPIFSSVYNQVSHPNIFKCLFNDKKADVPPFITQLMVIILTMENLGHNDHHLLLRDLLELTQVPLATRTSHGLIHKSFHLYDIGVRFAMETTSLKMRKAALFKCMGQNSEPERNIYHLPWNVRGLVDDLLKTKHIGSVRLLKNLVTEFRNWEPATKPWRDIKQCFAAFEEVNPDDLML